MKNLLLTVLILPVFVSAEPWVDYEFSEEVVEDAQSGLEIQIDNVLGPGLGLRQATIHHQLESQTNIRHFFVKRLK